VHADDHFLRRSPFIPTPTNDRWATWTRRSIRKWRPAGTGRLLAVSSFGSGRSVA